MVFHISLTTQIIGVPKNRDFNLISPISIKIFAEKKGFEPSIPFWGIHAFQACAFDRSATSLIFYKIQCQITKKLLAEKNFRR